jgi:hypothetical protein
MNDAYQGALASVDASANWSDWASFAAVGARAPTTSGVYLFRTSPEHRVIYVGIAGPRDGNGTKDPSGLRGRFAIYRGGRVTGFGQAIFDTALADREFLSARLAELETGTPRRGVDWVRAAYEHYRPEVRWVSVNNKQQAIDLEKRIVTLLRPYDLLNRVAVIHRARLLTLSGTEP